MGEGREGDGNRDMGASASADRATAVEPVPVSPLRDGIPSAGPRPNFAEFADALLIAASMYTDVELAFWLTAPQPLIGMWTPVQLLARGEADKLRSVMRAIEDGAYV